MNTSTQNRYSEKIHYSTYIRRQMPCRSGGDSLLRIKFKLLIQNFMIRALRLAELLGHTFCTFWPNLDMKFLFQANRKNHDRALFLLEVFFCLCKHQKEIMQKISLIYVPWLILYHMLYMIKTTVHGRNKS